MTSKRLPGRGLQKLEYWLRAGLTKQEYDQIAGQIAQSNCQNLMVYSAIATFFC